MLWLSKWSVFFGLVLFCVITIWTYLVTNSKDESGNLSFFDITSIERELRNQRFPNASQNFETSRQQDLKAYRYLPLDLLEEPLSATVNTWMSQKCRPMPKLEEIGIQNTYWQHFAMDTRTLYLLSAYWDNRLPNEPLIRVIFGASETNNVPKFKCRIWFESATEPVDVDYTTAFFPQSASYKLKHPNEHFYFPHIASCQVPANMTQFRPIAVSIAQGDCRKETNLLRIRNAQIDSHQKRQGIGMCVKALFYPTEAYLYELAEWIEIVLALGARKVHISYIAITPQLKKMLDLYEKKGLVELWHITWPGDMPTTPWAQSVYIKNVKWLKPVMDQYIYNDCFYNNLYNYEFIPLLDWDEIIMPTRSSSWQQFLHDSAEDNNIAIHNVDSLKVYHHYFFPTEESKASKFRILSSHLRTVPHLGEWQRKAFFNTRTVIAVFNHGEKGCNYGPCQRNILVNQSLGTLNHYRDGCVSIPQLTPEVCRTQHQNVVHDDRVRVIRNLVMDNVEKIIGETLED